mmetsp:Transcript_2271/g.4667  ORF Transcript_2271/g.4667 Transcript_2271/m.4667 type:complete len:116 (-) Transcript_2271:12-359(-)
MPRVDRASTTDFGDGGFSLSLERRVRPARMCSSVGFESKLRILEIVAFAALFVNSAIVMEGGRKKQWSLGLLRERLRYWNVWGNLLLFDRYERYDNDRRRALVVNDELSQRQQCR